MWLLYGYRNDYHDYVCFQEIKLWKVLEVLALYDSIHCCVLMLYAVSLILIRWFFFFLKKEGLHIVKYSNVGIILIIIIKCNVLLSPVLCLMSGMYEMYVVLLSHIIRHNAHTQFTSRPLTSKTLFRTKNWNDKKRSDKFEKKAHNLLIYVKKVFEKMKTAVQF